ncbi:hypothetical protein BH11BAC4_BH11BAC4_21440 [soil metagenome]
MKKDIAGTKDIELLVNRFYEKVKSDARISHFFTDTMKVNWERHLPVMYRFWDNALFFTGTYSGHPLEVHQQLHALENLQAEDFQQWNKLFTETVDELFEGAKATLAKERANSISSVMQLKILKKN